MGTFIWPASGLALAGMLLWGPSIWPTIFFGTLIVHKMNGDPLLLFVGPAMGNTLEAFVGFQFFSHEPGINKSLSSPQDIVRFVVGAALLGSIAGTLVGVTWLGQLGYSKVNFYYYMRYWSGDYIGILLIAPLILVFSQPNRIARFAWKNISLGELAAFLLTLSASTALFVVAHVPIGLYFSFPLMLWAALRLGQRGGTVVTIIAATITIWQCVFGMRPFGVLLPQIEREFFLAFFVAVLQITGLVFASIVMGRETERINKENSMARSQAELQLLNKELSEAVRTRDEFLTVASHELKTPVTPLKLRLQMMMKSAELTLRGNPIDRNLVKDIGICLNNLNRLSSLTEELLNVSRIRTGHLTIHPENFDLSHLTRNIVEQYKPEFEKNGTALILHLDQAVPGTWDREKMEEVVVNLLTNSIKFAAGHPVEISVLSENGTAKFIIRDHGPGISLNDQARIFQRFERAVSAQHYGGLGLGLYISRQIIEAHHGSIFVKSEPGKGATFTFQLPLKAAISEFATDELSLAG